MEIVLKEDLNVARRYVRGATVDLDRPVITSISHQLGRTDWYESAGTFQQRQNAAAMPEPTQEPVRNRKGR